MTDQIFPTDPAFIHLAPSRTIKLLGDDGTTNGWLTTADMLGQLALTDIPAPVGASAGWALTWNGTAWAAAAPAAAPVSSVAGKTGAVTLTHTDITDWASATAGFGSGGAAITLAATSVGPTDLLPILVGGIGGTLEGITPANYENAQGILLSSVAAASTPAGADTLLTVQGTTPGLQSLSNIAAYVQGTQQGWALPTLTLTAATTILDATNHNQKLLIAVPGATTISPPGVFGNLNANATQSFFCYLFNATGGTLTFGTGAGATVFSTSGVSSLAAGKMAMLFGSVVNGVNEIVAVVIGAGSAAATLAITITQIATAPGVIGSPVAGTPFTVAGALSGFSYAPALYYSDDGTVWLPVPSNAVVSPTSYSFTHPGRAAGTGLTTWVKDAEGTIAVMSAAYAVTTPTGPSVTISPMATHAILAGSTTYDRAVTVTLAAYASAPLVSNFQYSLNGGAFGALPTGITPVVSGSSAPFTLTFTIQGMTGGTYSLVVKDTVTAGLPTSPAVSFSIESVAVTTPVTSASVGTAVAFGASVTMLGMATGYGCWFDGTTEYARTSFASGGVPSVAPAGAGGSAYQTRIYDAASAGNLLYQGSAITVSAAASLTITSQPSTATTGTNITISGTYTGTAPTGFTYSWNAAGGSGTVPTATIVGGNWSATFPCSTVVSTSDVVTITETGAVSSSVTSTAINVSAPAPFSVTAIAPQAIGVAGSAQVFDVTYTGTWNASLLTVLVDGGVVAPTANSAGSGGVGTLTITAPAPSAFTGTTYGQGPVHTISLSGAGTATSRFAANASATYPGNAYALNPETIGSTFARPNNVSDSYVYIGTESVIAPTVTGSWNLSNNGSAAPSGGGWVNTGSGTGKSAITGWSPSLVVPPSGGYPAPAALPTNPNNIQQALHTGGNVAFGAGGYVWAANPAGNYYAWLITSDGYCFVRPTAMVVT